MEIECVKCATRFTPYEGDTYVQCPVCEHWQEIEVEE